MNLVPRDISLPISIKNPDCGWSRGSQNLGANKDLPHGRVVNYTIVAVVRKTQNALESLQAREDCFEVSVITTNL